MNESSGLQFEATNFFHPTAGLLIIASAIILAAILVGILLDKYGRINFSSINMATTMMVAFIVTMLTGTFIISTFSIENPNAIRVNNIEKAYEDVEVIDLTYPTKDQRVVTLLVDGQTVTATLREDPDTFEPTLYPYASEETVKLEKVSSK